jgi:hypothetical protein
MVEEEMIPTDQGWEPIIAPEGQELLLPVEGEEIEPPFDN